MSVRHLPSAHVLVPPCSPYWHMDLIGAPAVASPVSVVSRISQDHTREKAERILVLLVSLLSNSPTHYNTFASALPLTRICLLLLGDRPTPVVAIQILTLIDVSLTAARSFNRKFEIVSGWTLLRTVLPYAWDEGVHKVAFRILLGRTGTSAHDLENGKRRSGAKKEELAVVVCPQIMPAVFASLQRVLGVVANHVPPLNPTDEAKTLGECTSCHYQSNAEIFCR